MGAFTAGHVVIVPFPFSDLSQSKFRPAIVLADCGRGDYMLCQVTSNAYGDARAVAISNADFNTGGILRPSFARPGKIFTAHRSLIAN